MGGKKTKAAKKAVKKIINEKVQEQKLMPDRQGLSYVANMDNVIFTATFKAGSEKDLLGVYVPAHQRDVETHIVTSVGPMVNNVAIKKGAKIIPIGPGKITILEVDEKGFVGSIKPHDIIAIVK